MDSTEKRRLLSGFDVLGLAVTRFDKNEGGDPVIWIGDREATEEEIEAARQAAPDPSAGPVPREISDRQFAQVLAIKGVISEDEALAWASRGELPIPMEQAVSGLPEEQQFGARMLLSSATVYERNHPLVPALGSLLSYEAADLDALWRQGAAL